MLNFSKLNALYRLKLQNQTRIVNYLFKIYYLFKINNYLVWLYYLGVILTKGLKCRFINC